MEKTTITQEARLLTKAHRIVWTIAALTIAVLAVANGYDGHLITAGLCALVGWCVTFKASEE